MVLGKPINSLITNLVSESIIFSLRNLVLDSVDYSLRGSVKGNFADILVWDLIEGSVIDLVWDSVYDKQYGSR